MRLRGAAFRPARLALMACVGSLCVPGQAHAGRFFRARFEPETLELQEPGQVEIDGQVGGFYGDGSSGSRLVVPDVEIDLGLTSWLELDFDGALSMTHLAEDHTIAPAGDPLWLSARLDVLNWKDEKTGASFGVGLQAGPRFPSVRTPLGVGFAGLALVGGGTKSVHVVLSSGAIFDRGQSRAIAYGLDWQVELNDLWSLLRDASAVHYFGSDPSQFLLDAGVAYKANAALQFSLLAMAGPLVHGDRVGGLAGVMYTFRAWGHEALR